VIGFVPIFDWLPNYKWRKNVFIDLLAAINVGAMHVPQSMGYAALASLPPVYGLYTSVWPSLTYAIFGWYDNESFPKYA
jgi:MFS superfamily sulfate permease-like transporter